MARFYTTTAGSNSWHDFTLKTPRVTLGVVYVTFRSRMIAIYSRVHCIIPGMILREWVIVAGLTPAKWRNRLRLVSHLTRENKDNKVLDMAYYTLWKIKKPLLSFRVRWLRTIRIVSLLYTIALSRAASIATQ